MTIRQEQRKGHRAVEELVRDAFWDIYHPGCYEHLVVHRLRDDGCFINHSLSMARELGIKAVFIEGDLAFYQRCGFSSADMYGIYEDEGRTPNPCFLAKELSPGFLEDKRGIYRKPCPYFVTDEDVEAYDRFFPPRQNGVPSRPV